MWPEDSNLCGGLLMFEWFDFPTFMNSVIGSLFVGLVLVSAAPLWMKCLKPLGVVNFKKVLGVMVFPGILIGFVVLSATFLGYSERSRTPSYHPDLSDEEAARVYAECEMESIEATSAIGSRSSRDYQRVNYRGACLIKKGFKWELEDAE